MTTVSLAAQLADLEGGLLDDDGVLDLFAELVRSGLAWSLQGSYGRTAAALIDEGLISEFGDRVDAVLVGEVVESV